MTTHEHDVLLADAVQNRDVARKAFDAHQPKRGKVWRDKGDALTFWSDRVACLLNRPSDDRLKADGRCTDCGRYHGNRECVA